MQNRSGSGAGLFSFLIFPGDGVEGGFYLERSHIGMAFEKQRDDSGDMRTSETVAGKISVAAPGPGCANIYARRSQLYDLAIMETEFERVGLLTFDDGDQ